MKRVRAVFKQRGAVAAQHEIKTVSQRVQRYGGMGIQLGDQRPDGIVVIDGFDDRTLFDQRIAFKIHLRN